MDVLLASCNRKPDVKRRGSLLTSARVLATNPGNDGNAAHFARACFFTSRVTYESRFVSKRA